MRIMLTRDRPSENRREYVEDIKGREELGNRDATHLNLPGNKLFITAYPLIFACSF